MIRLLLDTTTAQAQRKAGVELLQTLPNSITELLLISHRDLHRLPSTLLIKILSDPKLFQLLLKRWAGMTYSL